MATDLRTVEDYEARIAELRSEIEDLDKKYEGQRMGSDDATRWDDLNAEVDDHKATIDELRTRINRIAGLAGNDDHVERTVQPSVQTNRGTRVPTDIHDLGAYRANTSSDEQYRQALRDGAMTAVDKMRFPHPEAKREKQQEHMRNLLDTVDDQDGTFARRVLATSSPTYQRAFGKMLAGQPLNNEEQRVLALGTQGGTYPVPITLDPTVILTSNGQVNPLRQIARNIQITGSVWDGVASTGVTAAYGAELAVATDNSPTLTQPTATVAKAQAFVPFSIEVGEDWNGLQTEMSVLLQDAKDALEATKFLGGSGTNEPQGLLVGGTAVTTTAATATFAIADLYTLVEALAERWQPNASIIGHRHQLNKVRQFDTAGGASLWVQLQQGYPQRLLDYSTYKYSSMSSSNSSGASILTIGDFSKFAIIDRVGMSIELIPHMMSTVSGYPLGQRGIYCHWRNTSLVLTQLAFKTLKLL